MPASLAAAFVQPGIAYVPVSDIPPIKICLGWRADSRSPLVAEFVTCVENSRGQRVLQRTN